MTKAAAASSVDIGEIASNTPLRLDLAARIAFPDGSMGSAGLRKERDKGRLSTEIIAGKEYVTLAEIERMRELCRVQRREPVLSGGRKAARPTVPFEAVQDGGLKTAERELALASARERMKKRKQNSPNTLPKNTPQRESADVIPLRS